MGRSLHKSPARAPVWLPGVALLLAVSLPHLDQGDFRTDTAWYAAIALQAARTGSWWTLYAEPGEPYFNKPPLVFWLHAPLLWAAGPRLWTARLPTVLAAAGCVALTAMISRLGLSRAASACAGCVLALTLEFFRRTREISLDMWQALFLLAAVWLAARGLLAGGRRGGVGMILLAGVPLGLALMCKPIQALLGAVALGAWWLVASTIRRGAAREPIGDPPAAGLIGLLLACMVLLAFAVATPWHLSMVMLHGDAFVARAFGAEIASRARGDLSNLAVRPQPWWFYLGQVGETYWPWLVAVGACAWLAARRRLGLNRRAHAIVLLGVIWAALWLVALSAFPDRRDRYALVVWPGLAVVCAGLLDSVAMQPWKARVSTGLRWTPAAAALIGLGLALAPLTVSRPIDPQWPALFAWLRSAGSAEVYRGGITGNASARLYLEFGRWPIPARPSDLSNENGAVPPKGSLLLYHRRGGRAPGPGEEVLFQQGDLTVTRLSGDGWHPAEVSDPGE